MIIHQYIRDILVNNGLSTEYAEISSQVIAQGFVILISIVSNFLAKPLVSGITYLIAQTKTEWDDKFTEHNVLNKLTHIAPAMVIYLMSPLALEGNNAAISFFKNTAVIYIVIVSLFIISSFLNAAIEIYRTFDGLDDTPITGFVQLIKIILYFIGFIYILSILLNKSPIYLLSGLGALTAVLMLIFKDTLLGLVSGIQLSANKMVARGDWIEMPKYGADGDILEITLTTVKVQNWDKTITTIPTYALINDSFKNWSGMKKSGGRRIKRSINIDLTTIKLCTEEMIKRFSKIQYIADYISMKKNEVDKYNKEFGYDDSSVVNGRRLTNIGTFRAYVVSYLKNRPDIHEDMTFLVRQLAPSEHGLPMEIYVFCKDTVWSNYEAVQADIFDHLLSVIPEFDLRVYQYPSGSDLKNIAGID